LAKTAQEKPRRRHLAPRRGTGDDRTGRASGEPSPSAPERRDSVLHGLARVKAGYKPVPESAGCGGRSLQHIHVLQTNADKSAFA